MINEVPKLKSGTRGFSDGPPNVALGDGRYRISLRAESPGPGGASFEYGPIGVEVTNQGATVAFAYRSQPVAAVFDVVARRYEAEFAPLPTSRTRYRLLFYPEDGRLVASELDALGEPHFTVEGALGKHHLVAGAVQWEMRRPAR